jgi:hypothetical protein
MGLPASQWIHSTPLGLFTSYDLIPRVPLLAIKVKALTGFRS